MVRGENIELIAIDNDQFIKESSNQTPRIYVDTIEMEATANAKDNGLSGSTTLLLTPPTMRKGAKLFITDCECARKYGKNLMIRACIL